MSKGTVATMLQTIAKRKLHGYDPSIEHRIPDPFIEIAFGDTLKEIASLTTGIPINEFYTQEGKATFIPELNMTVGESLQKIGESMRENVHADIWVFSLMKKLHVGHKYIVTDVRKFNEVLPIHAKGGIVLRIDGNPAGMQGDGTRNDACITETGLDDYPFEYRITNDGTKEELFQKVLAFYENVIAKHN